MTDNDILKLGPHIKKAAKFVSYQWPGVMEADDAAQAINLQLLESPGSIRKILKMERDAQYRAIVGIGNQLASKERANLDYFRGSYRYSVQEVKDVLAMGILVEEFDDWNEVVHDLIEALVVLVRKSPQYVDSLLERYVSWEIPTGGAEKKRLSDALTAVTWQMNVSNKRRFSERDDGPGTRSAVGRERARYQSKDQYDSDAPVMQASMRDNRTEKEVWES